MRRIINKFLLTAVVALSITLSECILAASSAVVLMYHRVGESKYPSTNIKVEQLVQQLNYIQQNGYQVWPLRKIIGRLAQNEALPDKVVAITFDDAYASVYKIAYPILQQRKMPFTLFAATNPIDSGFENYMSWEQLKDMAQNGVEIGNHSRTHHHLIERLENETQKQWAERVTEDILSAAKRIKQKAGVEPTLFAYPYGEYNIALSNIVKAHGYVGFGQHSGPAGVTNDKGFLPRFPVSEHFADMDEFATKLASLSLPLANVTPNDTIVNSLQPRLTIKLAFVPKNKQQLQCYVSGQGRGEINWHNDSTFSVEPVKSLTMRRSRYNCTMPSNKSGRYYWYSHLWIRPEIPEL